MKVTNSIQIQKILEIALKTCQPREYQTFSAWLLDMDGFNPTFQMIADRTCSCRQSVSRDFKSLDQKGVLKFIKKEPIGKTFKNVYGFGPIFDEVLSVENKPAPTNNVKILFHPSLTSLQNYNTIAERAQKIISLTEARKLKPNKYNDRDLAKLKSKLQELKVLVETNNFKNFDFKIKDLFDLAWTNRNRLKNHLTVDQFHVLPTLEDIDLPKLPEVKKDKTL